MAIKNLLTYLLFKRYASDLSLLQTSFFKTAWVKVLHKHGICASGFVLHFIFITLLLLLGDQIFKIKLKIPVIGLKMLILQYTSILLILGKYWFLKFYSFFFFCSKFWSTYSLSYSFRYLITYSSIFFLLFTVSTTCYFTIEQNCIISRLGITLVKNSYIFVLNVLLKAKFTYANSKRKFPATTKHCSLSYQNSVCPTF